MHLPLYAAYRKYNEPMAVNRKAAHVEQPTSESLAWTDEARRYPIILISPRARQRAQGLRFLLEDPRRTCFVLLMADTTSLESFLEQVLQALLEQMPGLTSALA